MATAAQQAQMVTDGLAPTPVELADRLATALLDGVPGLTNLTDAAVRRREAQRIVDRVRLETIAGGEDLLAGATDVEVRLAGGRRYAAPLTTPPGAPGHPLDDAELARKARDCAGRRDASEILAADREQAATLVNRWFER